VFAENDFLTADGDTTHSVSEDIFNRGFCLPSDIKNTPEDMEKIIKIVKNCFK